MINPCLHIDNLWYRQGLTPSYPQGSAWELISNNVTKVSVGPLDQVRPAQRQPEDVGADGERYHSPRCSLQVWIIADSIPGFPAEAPGAVCHRLGLGPLQPKGQSWDYGIGVSDCTYICQSPVTLKLRSLDVSSYLDTHQNVTLHVWLRSFQ